MTTPPPEDNRLLSLLKLFRYYKKLGEQAMAQVPEAELFQTIAPGANSISIIVGHLNGNMRSRWTDFLSTDGEKAWRQRDQEFEEQYNSREQILEAWETGWQCLFSALEGLDSQSLAQTVYIRGQAHSVEGAIHRQLAHYSYHCGQIVLLAKCAAGNHWTSLSIPKGGSDAFNQQRFNAPRAEGHYTDNPK